MKLTKNLPIKILSIIFGFIFWLIFSQSFNTALWVKIPLSFYGDIEKYEIIAPENIKIELEGKRSDFYIMDLKETAIHLNINKLKKGKNTIKLTSENLFLPKRIKLINYIPSNIVVEIKKD